MAESRWNSQYGAQKYGREERKTTLTQTGQMALGGYSANERGNYANTGMPAPKVTVSEGDMRNQLRLIKSKMTYVPQRNLDRETEDVSNQLDTLNQRLQDKTVATQPLPRNRSIPQPNYAYNNKFEQGGDTYSVRQYKPFKEQMTSNSYNSTNNTAFGQPPPRRAIPADDYRNPVKSVQNYEPPIQPRNYNQLTFQQQQQLKQNNQNPVNNGSNQQGPSNNGYQLNGGYQQTGGYQPAGGYQLTMAYQPTKPIGNGPPSLPKHNDAGGYNPSVATNAQPRQLQRPRNPIDEMPAVANSNKARIDEEPADDEDLIDCPEGCGRQFREEALEKHTKVCKKVFQSKRKEFNSKAHRIVSQEQQKLQKVGQVKAPKAKPAGKEPKWKQQSEQFRSMLQNGSSGGDYHDPREDDYVECPGCGRKFNETAAEKHIPSCQNRQRTNKKNR